MPLQRTVILDLSRLETSTIEGAGLAIAHVQMCLSKGQRVLVVVAPDARRVGRDLVAANRLAPTADASDRASILTSGAIEQAARFAEILGDIGLSAAPALLEAYPSTRGHPLDAEPRSVSASAITSALREADIVVVPGSVGRDDDGRLTFIGSDSESLTALFLADRLAIGGEVPLTTLEGLEGEISQAEETYGRRKARRFTERTSVEMRPVRLGDRKANSEPLLVEQAGNGPASQLIAAWSEGIRQAIDITPEAPANNSSSYRESSSNRIMLDLNTSAESSYETTSRALRAGRTVVTSNTALIAARGGGLAISSLIGGGSLRASATIAGCPSLAQLLDQITDWPGTRRVQGTFSPTGDLVLDLRSQGHSTEDAESIAADRLGLSRSDIELARRGEDAMQTLGAIAQLGFGAPASIRASSRGPEHVTDADLRRATSQGRRYRVVATVERVGEEIALRVGPVPLRTDDPLVNQSAGAVEAVVETRTGESLRASGRLHQPGSIAGAILLDLIRTLQDPSLAAHAVRPDAAAFNAIA
ncbi:MAG: hypothetical protein AB8F26_02100 [Phycisphaerales bacterium]